MTNSRVVSLFRRSHGDRVFRGVLTVAAVIIPVLLALLVWQLWGEAHMAIGRFGAGFITTSTWDPVAERIDPRGA